MSTSTDEITRLLRITASERAAELNAETQAWVDAAPGRGAGFLVEDAAHWAASDVLTGLELERTLLIGGFSDDYKAFNGIRPRWISFDGLNFAECEELVERLLPTQAEWEAKEAAEAAWLTEREAEDKAIKAEAAQALRDAAEDALWALQGRLER